MESGCHAFEPALTENFIRFMAKNKEPSVEPELIFKDGRWLFVNFRYAEGKDGDDLMSILKLLREERQKNPIKEGAR